MRFVVWVFGVSLLAILACARANRPIPIEDPLQGTPGPGEPTWTATVVVPLTAQPPNHPTTIRLPTATAVPTFSHPPSTPTPDATHPPLPTRASVEEYTVQTGDTLGIIAERYGLSLEELLTANDLDNPDIISVGQVLLIPVTAADIPLGPGLKLIPDSELVYSPSSIGFSVEDYVYGKGGYLSGFTEDIDGETMTGAGIVQRVADFYSVNPRILLAVLEYQSGWVTLAQPRDSTLTYPIGRVEAGREGLYKQLAWAADQLNAGYYWWRSAVVGTWTFPDQTLAKIDPGLNAGTAGVQHFFSTLYTRDEWTPIVSADGFIATYESLFGYPFTYSIEPLVPRNLTQPLLALPFETGEDWAFTGGPHGGWASGSGWAGLDFAPPADEEGCVSSDEWVTASAPGLIVRVDHGAVIQDLDGDGYEQSGWMILYMHIEPGGRVRVDSRLQTGDRIGHPSCEGGFANGTHVHLARRYNGEWIAADGDVPFVLDGWVSTGTGVEYDGFLTKDDVSIEACDCRADANIIKR